MAETSLPRPYLGLGVIFRDNADTLPNLLASIRGHFDFYSFTDTGSVDGSRALVEAFLGEPGVQGVLSDFTWIDDFSAARNFCFSKLPSRWRMFLDSDDELQNGDKLRPTLIATEASNPQVEAFFFKYDYDNFETHPTMRLCRHRDGWSFRDAIHERLEFGDPQNGGGLPDEAFGRSEHFVIKHKYKTKEEKERAIRRNARIAEKEYLTATDPKYIARLDRTLGMEFKMDGKFEETLPYFENVYNHYRMYPEGRQAAADVAMAHQFLSDRYPDAKDEHLAVGLEWAKRAGPAYEAVILHAMGRYEEVVKAAQRSLGAGQQTTHEGYIFEQGAVYVTAAASVLKLDPTRVWEALRLLDNIPEKLRNSPQLLEHITAIRAEADLITIVIPGTPQPFDENGGGGMLGGSEEAVMYLTRELAALGRKVRVFTLLPPHRVPGLDRYGVDWQPVSTFNPVNECGHLVVWRSPSLVLQMMAKCTERKAPFTGVSFAWLWLHDSGLGLPPQQAQLVGPGVNGAVVLSDFHEKMIRRAGWTGKTAKLSNGIVEADFEPFIDEAAFGFDIDAGGKRDPFRVVYSSCPSRGLVQLLEMWPKVKAAVPEARLDIYYDWSMLERHQPDKYEQVVNLYEGVRHLDVTHFGGVDHATLHQALRGANVWAYSHFESPEVETFCISAVKAQACGATVLTVPNGALTEVTGGDAVFCRNVESYRMRLVELLKNPQSVDLRREIARKALDRYGWKKVAQGFSKLWSFKKEPDPK